MRRAMRDRVQRFYDQRDMVESYRDLYWSHIKSGQKRHDHRALEAAHSEEAS